jgi:fatty-acyl-CoA synthase
LQQREIARVVQQEVGRLGLSDIAVEVVQDNRRGHVACIRAGIDQEILAPLFGRYSFQVEWLN